MPRVRFSHGDFKQQMPVMLPWSGSLGTRPYLSTGYHFGAFIPSHRLIDSRPFLMQAIIDPSSSAMKGSNLDTVSETGNSDQLPWLNQAYSCPKSRRCCWEKGRL